MDGDRPREAYASRGEAMAALRPPPSDISARLRTGVNELAPRDLRRLARRAARARRRDMKRFEQLAEDHAMTVRQLRLLADAWSEGGASGLEAIGPAPEQVDEDMIERALQIIEVWRRRHFPLDALSTQVWRNRLTVYRRVPAEDPTLPLREVPLMQTRWTADGRWHLFRRAAQGEWWPVVVRGRRGRQSLSSCLDAVRVDDLNHFWGDEGPPPDLASGDGLPLE